jgi:hypothetical protein
MFPRPQACHVALGLVKNHLQLLHREVVQPGRVGAAGVRPGYLAVDVAVLKRRGDQVPRLANDEMGQGAAEPAAEDRPAGMAAALPRAAKLAFTQLMKSSISTVMA